MYAIRSYYGFVMGPVCQADGLENLLHPMFALGRLYPRQHQRQLDIFGGREARYEMEELEDETDLVTTRVSLRLIRKRRDVFAVESIATGSGAVQQSQDV